MEKLHICEACGLPIKTDKGHRIHSLCTVCTHNTSRYKTLKYLNSF
ncbi:MAG: hypothetical protein BAJALOKI2v1_70002 [Promethearchaeota archaeon]|nr:MAG: hypothetical protein BAJALOKI2v1_70002 [Candidatus Lokiarchaeota archaeon]